MVGLTLVIPEKVDAERDAVADAWTAQGGDVVRLGPFWRPPATDRKAVRLYGNDTFCLVVAQLLELLLVSPADDLLALAPADLLKRRLEVMPLRSAFSTLPAFVKPLAPKQFRAGVFQAASELRAETHGLPPDTSVLVSEIVEFATEARAFRSGAAVADCAVYTGTGATAEAREFAAKAAGRLAVPATCVLDVGFVPGRGWAVVEANATWAAGLNGCRSASVLDCIEQATRADPWPDA